MADSELRHRVTSKQQQSLDKNQNESTESSTSASRDEQHQRGPNAERDDAGAAVSPRQQHALNRWLADADRTRDELICQLDAQIGDTLREFVYNIIFDVETKRGGGSLSADLARLRAVDRTRGAHTPATKKDQTDVGASPSDATQKQQPRQEGGNRLYVKQFEMRSSVLTEMLRISHIRTVSNMFAAVLIIATLSTLLQDLVEQSSPSAILNIDQFLGQFENFSETLVLWLEMLAATILCVFPAFHYWHTRRVKYWQSGPTALAIFDYAFVVAYIAYQITFLVLSLRKMFELSLPVVSALIIVIEQVRLMMKAHAFVRESAGRFLTDFEARVVALSVAELQRKRAATEADLDGEEEARQSYSPHFSHFLYFLFAPTLVYRDTYPRTRTVRWRVVVNYAIQFAACVLFLHFIFMRFCAPTFQSFRAEHIHPKQMLIWLFSSMIPGSLLLLVGFYLLLHVWMNMFAEMLRFGDRLFYSDWWNSRTWARYYRTWNIVVHDWLYAYLYRDVYLLLGAKRKVSRAAAMSIVFLISAIFHEYIIAVVMGFFYPVLFFSFMGAGFAFVFLTEKGNSPLWNIFMWFCLFVGTGVILCLMTIEWFARKNCQPIAGNPALDFFYSAKLDVYASRRILKIHSIEQSLINHSNRSTDSTQLLYVQLSCSQ